MQNAKKEVQVARMRPYHLSEWYAYSLALNECLHNHPESNKRGILHSFETEFAFDLNRFWFCLTGIKKDIYWPVYGYDANEYISLFDTLRGQVEELIHGAGYRADIFMVMKEDEKQMAILMSETAHAQGTPEELAARIGERVQRFYEREVFRGDERYCNVTALTGPLGGFDAIREGYLQARALNDLSFFHMESALITQEWLEQNRNGADYPTVMEACAQLSLAVDDGNAALTEHCREELFLRLLKHSYSISLCRDALSFLKNMLQVGCTVYAQMEGLDLERLCRVESYLKIEECAAALAPVLERLCAAIGARGVCSRSVILAMYYIKNHYATDLALPEIARYANVTPAYLSGIFRENTGMALRDYITKTRIEAAKTLLLGERRVAQVAEAVGICDPKYFTRTFKRLTGITPAEYRAEQNKT